MAAIAAIHYREDLFPEPQEFRPERFLDGRPDTYAWIPFGGGVRRCIGASFAELEMRVVLREFIARADLRAASPEPEPIRVRTSPSRRERLPGHPRAATTVSAAMDRDRLRSTQAPLKERYAESPEAALVTLRADGALGEGVTCSVATGQAIAEAGLHPATGGDGTLLCSGDMLLEALVACAGVTLRAVATSLGIAVAGGHRPRRGRPRLPRHPRRRPRRPGRLPLDPARLRPRHRCRRGGARDAAEADRALLRRLPDPGDPAAALGGAANRLSHPSACRGHWDT